MNFFQPMKWASGFTTAAVSLGAAVFLLGAAVGEQEYWKALNQKGMKAYQEGHFIEARDLFLQALQQIPDTPNPQEALTLNNLGAAHEALGENEEAELRYRQSLSIVEAIQGPDHPDMVLGLNNLALLYFNQRQYQKAEPLWRRALKILETYLGSHHPHLVQTLKALGQVSQVQGNYSEAEHFYQRAILITQHSLGHTHPQLVVLLDLYAGLLRQTHREEEAEMVERQASSIRTQDGPP